MKALKISILTFAVAIAGVCFTSCNDADKYEDANTNNPSWVNGYNDSTKVAHPESLASTSWTRGTGLKVNAYGEDVQGYVESLNFVSEDSVIVKMSEPTFPASLQSQSAVTLAWTDASNKESNPMYEYTYSSTTGKFDIMNMVKDEKGKVSKTAIFTGIATSDGKDVITIAHYGDTPVQTYLVKQ